MFSLKFLCLFLFVVATVYAIEGDVKEKTGQEVDSKIIEILRRRRSPIPEPTHRKKYNTIIQPVPIQGGGCSVCGGGGLGGGLGGGHGGSFSQSSSHSSSSSYGFGGGSSSQSSSSSNAGSKGFGK